MKETCRRARVALCCTSMPAVELFDTYRSLSTHQLLAPPARPPVIFITR